MIMKYLECAEKLTIASFINPPDILAENNKETEGKEEKILY